MRACFCYTETMKEQKWWHRLFIVLYFISLALIALMSLLAAVIVATENYGNPDWLPDVHSGVFFAAALTGLISLFTLELIRKVSVYVSADKKFLSFDFPKISIVLAVIFVVLLGISGVTKFTYESHLQSQWVNEKRVADTAKLTELENLLEEQREEAKTCLVEKQTETLASDKELCEARYRRVKMGYDSCMMYGWHTMCLQSDDYEVIDCSEEALTKPVETFYRTCSEAGVRTMNQIEVIKENLEYYEAQ